jgi:hypothetical protein
MTLQGGLISHLWILSSLDANVNCDGRLGQNKKLAARTLNWRCGDTRSGAGIDPRVTAYYQRIQQLSYPLTLVNWRAQSNSATLAIGKTHAVTGHAVPREQMAGPLAP